MGTTSYFNVTRGVKLNQILLLCNVALMLCLFSSMCFKYHFMVKKKSSWSDIFVCALTRGAN